jgi:hypothetical protein
MAIHSPAHPPIFELRTLGSTRPRVLDNHETARATRSKQRLEECQANAAFSKSRGSVSQSRPSILVRVDGEGVRDSRGSISRAQLPTEAEIVVY